MLVNAAIVVGNQQFAAPSAMIAVVSSSNTVRNLPKSHLLAKPAAISVVKHKESHTWVNIWLLVILCNHRRVATRIWAMNVVGHSETKPNSYYATQEEYCVASKECSH